MKFEHLIEVNDLANPLQMQLTREELWFGLLCRAEDACIFLPGLEACHIIERSEDRLVRDLHFGSAIIRDCVTFDPLHWMRFESEANEEHPGGSLVITIEEPEPAALFLRFSYTTSFASNPNSEERAYIDYIKSAYHQSDVDCVQIIRTLAAGGLPQ